MLKLKKRVGDAARARRRMLLTLLLVPIAGCASRGGIDQTASSISPVPFQKSFVAVPARLGQPDQALPDWTPDLQRSRAMLSQPTHQSVASNADPLPPAQTAVQTPDQTAVETVSGLGELLRDEVTVATVYRPASHRMQVASEAEQLARVASTDPLYSSLGASSGLEAGQPIDLGAALGMAGGNAWTIQLARQKTVEAHAELDRAKAIWIPDLQIGVGWNKHEGRIQATEGTVIETSRNSVFFGGGAKVGNAPVAGGSGGPFRLAADLALAEAYFGPKIARRYYQAERFGISVAKNQAMLKAGTAYIDLLEAAGQVADAQAAIAAADELVNLTEKFEEAGAGALADVDRAVTERARLQQDLQNATRRYRVRSAVLARRLRLDPTELLQPADQFLVPISLASQDGDPLGQIAMAMSERPEICEQLQRISALCIESRKEAVAPWIPNVTMASSAGTFGGGMGSNYTNQGGRGDLDLQAVWELENMGYGVAAKRKRVASRLSQQRILLADLRDEIRNEVVQANENVANYSAQIQSTESALSYAESSYQRNLLRVRNAEGLPIELLQAINARAAGLRARTAAVAAYNRSQIELLYAMGQLQH